MEHLVIVDGHHLMYRAYWAIPRTMRTNAGEQVNTVFGVASMLMQILKTEQPDSILFCFDADEDTFRHKEYAQYKAGRAKTPDDFYTQIPRALQLIDTFGIRSVAGNSYEADDYACSYARTAERAGDRVTIVTGDRDLFQLASQTIRVAIPHKGYQMPEYMGAEQIIAKYGVTPAQIPAYKGLVGDHSDHLPGVKGIGPKAAAALLQKYGTLDEMYAHLYDIKPSWQTKLEQGREQAFFCQRMAVLTCDIEPLIPLSDLALLDIAPSPIIRFFDELQFVMLTKRFVQFLASPYGQAHFSQDAAAVSSSAMHTAATEAIKEEQEAQLPLL